MRRSRLCVGVACLLISGRAWGQSSVDDEAPVAGYSPADPGPTVVTAGYVDMGFADVQGNGSSFAPGDTRVPADYGVDAFATAVNSRGDVASTEVNADTNGFLPRSLGIGGRPSLFLSTVSTDLRASSASGKYLLFVRAQAFPRFTGAGDQTQVLIEQAFARFVPFASQEMALTVGKADSVFGIEYLENQANLRTGITPSLVARYTTGTQLGAKLFYRVQLPSLWSAFSLNVAATNGPAMVDALQTQAVSLSGRPVLSGRVGYELNLPHFQIKLGGSTLVGPRNDQFNPKTQMRLWGADARLYVAGLLLLGEYVDVQEDEGGPAQKLTPQGPALFASGFRARGFWAQASYALPWSWGWLERATPYVRVGYRRARFEGFPEIEVARLTAGLRLDFVESVALKGEWLLNQERSGAPTVDNDVRALSLVLSW